ncbi:MAG TPA: hypothetical protein VIL86_20550 [Tepidisphaeraceae bacterium]|jgi:hypothetical protein
MRWLLHGPMTSAVGEALVRHEQTSKDLAAANLPADAVPVDILQAAQTQQLEILTTEAVMANAPFALDFWFGRCMVFLQLEGGDVEQDDAIDRLFARYRRLTPGRLYTVTGTRVKVRQLPGHK